MSTAVWCLLLLHNGASNEVAEVPASMRLERSWQVGPYCGPNCLYIFMKVLGTELTHDELVASFGELGTRGTSLQDLRAAAARYGVNVSVVKATEAGLGRLSLPFIAHLDMGPTGGHYVVVHSMTPRTVSFVDGTELKDHTLARAVFVRAWTGYALVPSSTVRISPMVLLGASVLAVLLVGCWWGRRGALTREVDDAV